MRINSTRANTIAGNRASGRAKIIERREGECYQLILRWKELWLKNSGTWQVFASQATPVNGSWDMAFIVPE